jgi:hypothetical protein
MNRLHSGARIVLTIMLLVSVLVLPVARAGPSDKQQSVDQAVATVSTINTSSHQAVIASRLDNHVRPRAAATELAASSDRTVITSSENVPEHSLLE